MLKSIGAFGEVRMCVHRDTGAQRAVKVLRKSHMDDDEKKMLFNEISILRNLVSTHKPTLALCRLGSPLFDFKLYIITLRALSVSFNE